MSSVQAEVGSQPKAQQMYIESVMNCASADRKTLEQTINNPRYYPDATKNQLGGATDAMREHYGPKFDRALAGSNEFNLATGNASLGVNRNYPTLAEAQGERFVLEQYKPHEAWQQNMQKSIAEQQQATMLKTNPATSLPHQDGLYSGNKLAGALPAKNAGMSDAEWDERRAKVLNSLPTQLGRDGEKGYREGDRLPGAPGWDPKNLEDGSINQDPTEDDENSKFRYGNGPERSYKKHDINYRVSDGAGEEE